MKTAVDAVFVGKERRFNRRFAQLMSHHLVEPTACTPAAGWEKGQVENQVGVRAQALLRAAPEVPDAATISTPGCWTAALPTLNRRRIPS